MSSNFKDFGISQSLLKAIEEMGFVSPTEVQSRAIPHILEKKDLIVMSKTGSGKTAVFGVSMLELIDPSEPGPQGLILTPTRELAVQVDSDLKEISKYLEHKTTAVYGQHSMNVEITALKKGVSIVTGTPGRIYDHIQHGNLVTKNIHFLVLDEADRMLDMGFIDQVEKIIKTLPRERITLLFSATIPSEIRRICSHYMKQPETIEIESPTKTVDTIQQVYYRVNYNEKNTWLNRLLLVEQPDSCMIFCNTKMAVDRVTSFLSRKGYACLALHGDIPQGKRIKSIQQFKQGEFHLLVATDVAARGIHIEGLSLVINYDVPNERDSYIHRIGRTGRAGKDGRAITFVTGDDIMSLYEIEEHIGAMIQEAELPTEEAYLARKAEAELWIKANTFKQELSPQKSGNSRQPVSAGRNRTTRPRANEGSQKQQGNSPDNRRTGNTKTTSHSTQNNPNQARPYDKRPSQYPSRNGNGKAEANNQKRPLYDGAPKKTGPSPSPHRSTSQAMGNQNTRSQSIKTSIPPAASAESIPTPAKKPFFKRVLDKLLGKK